MKTRLSSHACTRVLERIDLTIEQVIKILDTPGVCVEISREEIEIRTPWGTRTTVEGEVAYRLFFSQTDNEWFVAVQNIITGNVLTLLHRDSYVGVILREHLVLARDNCLEIPKKPIVSVNE